MNTDLSFKGQVIIQTKLATPIVISKRIPLATGKGGWGVWWPHSPLSYISHFTIFFSLVVSFLENPVKWYCLRQAIIVAPIRCLKKQIAFQSFTKGCLLEATIFA
jgi:hypothetical protein